MHARVLVSKTAVEWDGLAHYDFSRGSHAPLHAAWCARTKRLFVLCEQGPAGSVRSALFGNTVLRRGGRPVYMLPADALVLACVLLLEAPHLGVGYGAQCGSAPKTSNACFERLVADTGLCVADLCPPSDAEDDPRALGMLVSRLRECAKHAERPEDAAASVVPLFSVPIVRDAVVSALWPSMLGAVHASTPSSEPRLKKGARQSTLSFARVAK